MVDVNGNGPNKKQQQSFIWLRKNINKISDLSYEKLISYINKNKEDIFYYAKIKEIPENIFKIVKLKAIIFHESGSFAFLFDCKWDSDNGLAIMCKDNKIRIGTQNIAI